MILIYILIGIVVGVIIGWFIFSEEFSGVLHINEFDGDNHLFMEIHKKDESKLYSKKHIKLKVERTKWYSQK